MLRVNPLQVCVSIVRERSNYSTIYYTEGDHKQDMMDDLSTQAGTYCSHW